MNKNILNIENIRQCIEERKIIWTKHCLNRLAQRDILIEDVKNTIRDGTIIEYYYDDYPYQSCLIKGKDTSDEILHIVCGINDDMVYMITAYHPNSDKWENDLKTRREE